jgi:two-component system, sensor histidine kinase LadS
MKLLLLMIISFATTAAAGNPSGYILSDRSEYPVFDEAIWNTIEYLEDSTGSINTQNIRNASFKPFSHYQSSIFNEKNTYWFRLKLQNQSTRHINWFVELPYPYLNNIRAFTFHRNDFINLGSYNNPNSFSTKKVNHKNFIFPLNIAHRDSATVYFSFNNKSKIRFRVTVRPAESFIGYALDEYYYLGVYYGVILIMAFYNFLLFLSLRERIYIYYVFYVLCYCFNSLKADGLGFQYFWPNAPYLNFFEGSFSGLILLISFIIWSERFLSLSRITPLISKSIYALLFLYCILSYFFPSQPVWLNFIYLLIFALIFAGAVLSNRKGNYSSRYFIIGLSVFTVCYTVFTLRNSYIIPTNTFTFYALNFGFLIEVILFSLGMANRIKQQREREAKADRQLITQLKENEQLKNSLNKQLEIKVAERTLEVENKNLELRKAFTELEEKNRQIEGLNKLLENNNQLLKQDNENLSHDLKEINKARFLLKDLTFEEFQKIYPDENACLEYLAQIKWAKPYSCRKCSAHTFYKGKTAFSRRCSKCHYDESVTSFSIFHNSKMPVTTTFYLIYMIVANKDISSYDLSEKLGLRQKTCWAYKKKIHEKMDEKGKLNSGDWGKIFYD